MKKLRICALLFVCACMLLPGCARMTVKTGKAIGSLEGIEVGQTTRQQILEKYGPPQVVDDIARTAVIGENHLGYEERKAKGWYVSILGFVDLLGKDENSNTTIFLFNKDGVLIDMAQGNAQTGKSSAWSIPSAIGTGLMLK